MADERPPEARLARLEACYARLEERSNAQLDQRRDWKAEVERRLNENNENARKLMEERARDRAELVTQDLYNSRHSELKSQVESSWREMAQKIDTLASKFDARMASHEQDDNGHHDRAVARLQTIEEFISNLKGRFWALGVAVTLVSALVATLIQVLIHVLSGKS